MTIQAFETAAQAICFQKGIDSIMMELDQVEIDQEKFYLVRNFGEIAATLYEQGRDFALRHH